MTLNKKLCNWKCQICSKTINANKDSEPESLYWNAKLKEVYCSPECSLKRYEEIKKSNND